MDELNLDLDSAETNAEEKLKVKNRFQQLSEKVKIAYQERDEAAAKVKAEEEARLVAEKERDFYKDFSSNVSKYPAAAEYHDKIKEKVLSGYLTEDAMVSILNKEGKLSSPTVQAERPKAQLEGGSSPTIIDGTKPVSEMTVQDKFAALSELDKSGALAQALRGR